MPEPELTEQDQIDLQKLMQDTAENGIQLDNSVAFMWLDVLSNIEAVESERITPELALKIMRTWNLSMTDVPEYWSQYHAALKQAREVLRVEAAASSGYNDHVGKEDGEENADLYWNVLLNWNLLIKQWEDEWDVHAEDAMIRIAVMADVQNYLLDGGMGLSAQLQHIQLRWTEDDRERFAAMLTDAYGSDKE